MKRVLIFGEFDIIQSKHIKALAQAKSYGDHLIVALYTDYVIKEYLNTTPTLPYWQREVILKSLIYVDEVIPLRRENPVPLIKAKDIDVFCFIGTMGHISEKKYKVKGMVQVIEIPDYKDEIYLSERQIESMLKK